MTDKNWLEEDKNFRRINEDTVDPAFVAKLNSATIGPVMTQEEANAWLDQLLP